MLEVSGNRQDHALRLTVEFREPVALGHVLSEAGATLVETAADGLEGITGDQPIRARLPELEIEQEALTA